MVHEREIRIWMLSNDIRVQDVADGVGVHKSYVYHFLAGRKKALTIRAWFLKNGCPDKYLIGKPAQVV